MYIFSLNEKLYFLFLEFKFSCLIYSNDLHSKMCSRNYFEATRILSYMSFYLVSAKKRWHSLKLQFCLEDKTKYFSLLQKKNI